MASNDQQAPKGLKRKRFLRVLLPLVLSVCLIVCAALIWMLNSERGAQFALSTASNLSNGTLQVQGVSGQLNGALHIDQLSIHLENQKIVLDDLRLNSKLPELLLGKLHITSLQIGKLGIVSKIDQTPEPSTLPEKIALPIHLKIDRVRVNSGEIAWGPVDVIKLGAFAFNVNFDGTRYSLSLDQLTASSDLGSTAFSGEFKGEATLSAIKPYALQASIVSDSETMIDDHNNVNANGRIDLRGSLAEIAASINFHINQASIKGNAMLRPFADQMLGATDLSAQALDLSDLAAELPETDLSILLHAAENGDGKLTINNASAGLYNENRIPLSNLVAEFTQRDSQFNIDHLAANLGSARKPAGSLSGKGRYANGALALTLTTNALDLQKMDQRVRATKLTGNLEVQHVEGKQTIALALSEPLKKNKLILNMHAIVADEEANIDRIELRAGASAIDASAHIALSGKQQFDAKGTIRKFNLSDLGNFPQLPALSLNGNFSAKGLRQPTLEADVAFRIHDSQLAGQPLSGEGQAQLRAETLILPKLLLNAGSNRVSAQGKLAGNDACITFAVDAPALEQLGSGFSGAMQVNGEVRGKVQQPRITAEWKGNKLRMPGNVSLTETQGKADISLNRNTGLISNATINATAQGLNLAAQKIAKLSMQAQFAMQANAPVAINVRADGIDGTQLRAENFTLNVSGTTAQHGLNAALVEREQNWKFNASGGVKDLARNPSWQGSIDSLDATGRLTAKLAAPAALLISQKQVQLDQFKLNVNNAVIVIEQFMRNDRNIVTRGKFEHVQVSELLRYLKPELPLAADLTLGGDWDFKIADRLNGKFNMRRENGDVVMRGSRSAALGLTTLNANATADNGRITVALLTEGKQTGNIAVNLNTTMGSGSARFSIAPNAPLAGSARINAPTLGWLGSLISPSLITEGSIKGDIALEGTFGNPRLGGKIDADGLRLLFTDTGVDLKQGVLRSEFQGNQLLIHSLSFQNGGSLTIAGPLSLIREQLNLELTVKASKYKLIDRSDRQIVISGDSVLGWHEGKAKANGKFEINSGLFDVGSVDVPELSDDVVIVGQNAKQGTKTAVALDLSISLGDGIRLRGRGIDGLLVGQINLLANAGETLRAQGTLRIASGTFKAYGRELKIEQGLLRFSGPLNNPALDILAMRRGLEVEAGVSVRGTVLAPRITLVSEPTVADAEKLSWLVLGRALSSAGDSDISALQTAASSLLTQGAASGLQSQIATAFGLDDFSIGTSDSSLQERIITLGKKISARLYVSYQQGLQSASSVLLLRYTLTPRITVEGEAGTRSALSMFYNFAFD
ncbi:MAG: translocation/assembly module TamB domain-containing protein [Pseudomonadota bacterium]